MLNNQWKDQKYPNKSKRACRNSNIKKGWASHVKKNDDAQNQIKKTKNKKA
jgi:hypothetical protein